MDPELIKALALLDPVTELEEVEHRVYYDSDGCIISYSEQNHPDGNYIVLEDPGVFYNTNTMLLRVVDGKLTVLNYIKSHTGLQRSTTGQPVVKGMAALALTADEEYQDVEYYDRKTNC